jgi:polyphosphate kinase
LMKEVLHILQLQLDDTLKAHVLTDKGTYERIDKRGKVLLSCQEEFCKEAIAAGKTVKEVLNDRVFVPEEHVE